MTRKTLPEPRAPKPPSTEPAGGTPRLENGDHLDRAEFERRYHASPQLKKAELLRGVVYVPSPARYRKHGRQCRIVSTWLGSYERSTPGVEGADNATVRLSEDSETQPDHFLWIIPERGGQGRLSDDDYVEGAPELIVEIAASSASYDLREKKDVYRENGVLEYVVWRVHDRAVDWFLLEDRGYRSAAPDASGIHGSRGFPGLWLDTSALIQEDLPRVLEILEIGLSSPEHAEFVQRLEPGERR